MPDPLRPQVPDWVLRRKVHEPVEHDNVHAHAALASLLGVEQDRRDLSSKEVEANAALSQAYATLALAQEVKSLRLVLTGETEGHGARL